MAVKDIKEYLKSSFFVLHKVGKKRYLLLKSYKLLEGLLYFNSICKELVVSSGIGYGVISLN